MSHYFHFNEYFKTCSPNIIIPLFILLSALAKSRNNFTTNFDVKDNKQRYFGRNFPKQWRRREAKWTRKTLDRIWSITRGWQCSGGKIGGNRGGIAAEELQRLREQAKTTNQANVNAETTDRASDSLFKKFWEGTFLGRTSGRKSWSAQIARLQSYHL